jgi:hypothetical protein
MRDRRRPCGGGDSGKKGREGPPPSLRTRHTNAVVARLATGNGVGVSGIGMGFQGLWRLAPTSLVAGGGVAGSESNRSAGGEEVPGPRRDAGAWRPLAAPLRTADSAARTLHLECC